MPVESITIYINTKDTKGVVKGKGRITKKERNEMQRRRGGEERGIEREE